MAKRWHGLLVEPVRLTAPLVRVQDSGFCKVRSQAQPRVWHHVDRHRPRSALHLPHRRRTGPGRNEADVCVCLCLSVLRVRLRICVCIVCGVCWGGLGSGSGLTKHDRKHENQVADVFALLQAHYRGHPHVSLEQAAVVDEHDDNQTLNITRVPLAEVYAMEQECIGRPDAEMCRYAIGVGTLRPDDKSHWILKDKGVQEAVRGISLAALLRKHSVSDIDILQVDTEGYDGRILRQLDLAKYRPLLVQFECDHLGVPELADVMLRFARHGYRMRTFGGDLVAFLPELLQQI